MHVGTGAIYGRVISEPQLASITAYLDANGNQSLDAGERTTVTKANGDYSFDALTLGQTYTVRTVVPAGWVEEVTPGARTPTSATAVVPANFRVRAVLEAGRELSVDQPLQTQVTVNEGQSLVLNSRIRNGVAVSNRAWTVLQGTAVDQDADAATFTALSAPRGAFRA